MNWDNVSTILSNKVIHKKMHRLIAYSLPLLAIATIGVVGTLTVSTAHTIAGIVMVVVPLVLKFIPLDGAKMVLLSMATAIAVAVGSGFLSGEVTTSSFNGPNLLITVAALWAVSQAVFQLFKDTRVFGQYLK